MQTKHVPDHRVSEAVNPRTGRRERVFVNLEAVYPDIRNPSHEVSFEELRAIKRGYMGKNWHSQKEPLKQISGNASTEPPLMDKGSENDLPDQLNQKLALNDADQHDASESKSGKSRKSKVREVKGETQTGMPFFSRNILSIHLKLIQIFSQNEIRLPKWW